MGQPGGNGALTETPKRRSRQPERFVLHGTIITLLSPLNRRSRFFFLSIYGIVTIITFLPQYTIYICTYKIRVFINMFYKSSLVNNLCNRSMISFSLFERR